MNIGKNIREIRTKNNMSQEEFGRLFFITRQTVSNWENEKNFPDLKTLIEISDRFDISLDKLLKEDKEMVESITAKVKIAEKWNKYRRAVCVMSGAVIAAAAVSAGVYGAVWNSRRNKLEKNFNSAVAELGFHETDERVYQRSDSSGIKYVLPHQEMPELTDFSLDFHAKYVYAYFESGGQSFMLMTAENETFHLSAEDYPEKGAYFCSDIDENGRLTGENTLTDEQARFIDDNSEVIKTALSESKKIYNRAYL